MDALKESIFNYLLSFIKEREREVRTSDIFDVIMKQFSSKLKDMCSDIPFSDEMFIESTIRETTIVYGLTYTVEDGTLIGLTEAGGKAAIHPNGVSGYLDDIEKERKSLKVKSCIQGYTETIAAIVVIISFMVDYISPNNNWLSHIGYFACGIIIGLTSTRIFRLVGDKLWK